MMIKLSKYDESSLKVTGSCTEVLYAPDVHKHGKNVKQPHTTEKAIVIFSSFKNDDKRFNAAKASPSRNSTTRGQYRHTPRAIESRFVQ